MMCETKRRDLPKISLSFFLSLYMYIINVYVFKRSLSLSLNSFLKRSLSLSAGGKRRFWRKVFPPALWKNIKRAFKFVRSDERKNDERISIRVLRNSLLSQKFLSKSVFCVETPLFARKMKKSLSLLCCFFLAGGFFGSLSLFKKKGLFGCCLGLFTLLKISRKNRFFRETSSLFSSLSFVSCASFPPKGYTWWFRTPSRPRPPLFSRRL